MREAGINFEVIISGAIEHDGSGNSVAETVVINAREKAESVAAGPKGPVVIGADTLVVHDGVIIGKPCDEKAARELLDKFTGTDVEVYTGLCVIDTETGKRAEGSERSDIQVASVSQEEADRFFALMSPYDKAGGFSIEGVGSLLFDDIRGSYFNILGLPMMKLRELFKKIDLELLDFISNNRRESP